MKKGRFSEEQIIGILKRHEAEQKVADLAREHGISEATIYTWKGKYGGMEVKDVEDRLAAVPRSGSEPQWSQLERMAASEPCWRVPDDAVVHAS